MISQQQILSPLFDISLDSHRNKPRRIKSSSLVFWESSWMAQHDVSTAHQEATACHENDGHRFLATSILADRDDGMELLETTWEFKKVQLKMVGREHGPNTVYTWNPNDPCFDWKRPCFGGCNNQYRGQTGSRYILEKTCWDSLKTKQPWPNLHF